MALKLSYIKGYSKYLLEVVGGNMKNFTGILRSIDKTFLILVFLFAVTSVLMIASTAYKGVFLFNRDVKVQILAYFLGTVAFIGVLLIDYKFFENMGKFLYAFSIILLLLVYVPKLGSTQMGAQSWIKIGPLNFQPSEIVKISFVLLYSSYIKNHKDELQSFIGFFKALLFAMPIVLLIMKNDLGSSLVLCAMIIIMLWYAGLNAKVLGICTACGCALLPVIYHLMAPHQKLRIDAFLNPNDLSLKSNWQVFNSKVAIGSGGFLGKGPFHGTQKELDFVPVQKSDFIFSVIAEELGFLGGLFLILLFFIFLYKLFKMAVDAHDMYGSLIIMGIFAMFLFQIFENIAMTMGIMPVTGITLPFISYGGSGIISNMLALGLALGVSVRSRQISFK